MRSEDCKAVSVRKRERGQDESQEKELCKKSAISKEGTDKSDPPSSLEDLEYINLEQPLQGVDEERVRGLMRELMEELGIMQPAVHLHDAAAPALGVPDRRGGSTSGQNCMSSYDYNSHYTNYSQGVWHLGDVGDLQTFPGVEEAELSLLTCVDGDCMLMPRHLNLGSDGHVEITDAQTDQHIRRATDGKPIR